MSHRVVFTARARSDLIEQFHFLVDRSPAVAATWYAGIEKAIAKLATLPERHPVAQDESEQLGVTLRQMLYGRRPGVFRILFSAEKGALGDETHRSLPRDRRAAAGGLEQHLGSDHPRRANPLLDRRRSFIGQVG